MRRTRGAETVATPKLTSSGPDAIRAPFGAGADVSRFDFGHGTHARAGSNETAATGHGARVMRRLDEFARSPAEPAAPTRSHLVTPGHKTAAVRVAAWTKEAGTNADPDAAGDAVGVTRPASSPWEHRSGGGDDGPARDHDGVEAG